MASSVCFPDQTPVEQLELFAVAITTNGVNHAGVLFRGKIDKLDVVILLHLAGHNKLKVDKAAEVVPDNYAWVIPDLVDMELKQLAGFARVQAKNKHPLQFSFRYVPDDYCYAKGGKPAFTDKMHGFTCATYVLSMFDWLEIELLDYSTWLPRPDDEASQRHLLGHIASHGATRQHLAAVANEIPCLRFRPAEVAGACLSANRPVPMPVAEKIASELGQQMHEFYVRVGAA